MLLPCRLSRTEEAPEVISHSFWQRANTSNLSNRGPLQWPIYIYLLTELIKSNYLANTPPLMQHNRSFRNLPSLYLEFSLVNQQDSFKVNNDPFSLILHYEPDNFVSYSLLMFSDLFSFSFMTIRIIITYDM